MSFRRLSRLNDYADDSLRVALRRSWPKAEKVIARFLGVTPQTIWPSRYHADGAPKKDSGPRHTGARRAA